MLNHLCLSGINFSQVYSIIPFIYDTLLEFNELNGYEMIKGAYLILVEFGLLVIYEELFHSF